MIDVSQLLPKLVTASSGNQQLLESAATLAWQRVAGQGLRNQVVPFRLYRRTLIVAVSDAIWQKQLHQMTSEFVTRINRLLGTEVIDSIEFRIDSATVEQNRTIRDVTASDRTARIPPPEIVDASAAIKDSELRQLFTRAAANCLSRREAISRENEFS